MKLSSITLSKLAEMICGQIGAGSGYQWENFPYRSSSDLTRFFYDSEIDRRHDGTSRASWVLAVLSELNAQSAADVRFPADNMIRVIERLLDPSDFIKESKDYDGALEQANKELARDGLRLVCADGLAFLEHIPSQQRAARLQHLSRPPTPAEIARRENLLSFLNGASEDEFTERILLPLFQQLGFRKVKLKGHHDKSLEYGKDLWMKYTLPTSHVLYFGAQVKTGRIHASTTDRAGAIGGIISQIEMMLRSPVFDSDTNRNHLVDHVFLVASGQITEQARHFLSTHLDLQMRRNILYLDRAEIADLWATTSLLLPATSDFS